MIKEVIVVEGRDDIIAVKAAVDAEIIATNGYAYGDKLIVTLKEISKRQGIIILTDPDFMGEKIRKDISSKVKNCKHAFLPQGKALKKDDIGVENATPEDIRIALDKARPTKIEIVENFKKSDLLKLGLIGDESSNEKRQKIADILGIGPGNAKQFLNRLNSFGISHSEFEKALKRIDNDKE